MTDEFAGALRERVVIEACVGASDGAGNRADVWSEVGTFWAGVAADGFAVREAGERARAREKWQVTARAREDVTAAHRLRWRGRALRVVRIERAPVTPDRMTIFAEEV